MTEVEASASASASTSSGRTAPAGDADPASTPNAPPAARAGEPRYRPIATLDLARFTPPQVPGNRGPLWRAAWYLVNATVFEGALLGLLPSAVKAALLRAFGAEIGRGFVCKPRVSIKYPWFLSIGDHVWLGEGVWIDDLAPVRIGSNVVVSQGYYLGNGNHDWRRPDFPFFAEPIVVEDGVWLTAGQRLLSGTRVPAHHAVGRR
jgi:putative colanic acid biosynthesis acetyltransferase WcaF